MFCTYRNEKCIELVVFALINGNEEVGGEEVLVSVRLPLYNIQMNPLL